MADYVIIKGKKYNVSGNTKNKVTDTVVIKGKKYNINNSELKNKEEEKATGYFKSGSLFDDGYDFGDVTRTIWNSAGDIATDMGAGIMDMGESALDAFTYLGSVMQQNQLAESSNSVLAFNALLGNDPEKAENIVQTYQGMQDTTKQSAEDFIKKDLYSGQDVVKNIVGARNMKSIEGKSVLGDKSDALAQSGGQLLATQGLQLVGVPWFVTTGVTSFGSEVEGDLQNGDTFEQAGLSGLVTAGADILTEQISGGIKFGGKTLDDGLTSLLSRKISDKFLRSSAKFGIDVVGEGLEEALAYDISTFGNWLTHLDEESLWTMLTSEEAVQERIDSFIGGAALGGIGSVIGGAADHAKTQSQYRNTGRAIAGVDGGVDALKNLSGSVAEGVTDPKLKNALVKQAESVSSETASGKGLGKVVAGVKNANNATKVGKLYDTVQNANNLANASANKADLVKSLERKGFDTKDADTIAQALVDSYNGKELSGKQEKLLKALENNQDVQDAISNIVENEKSTMGQRSQNIRDFENDVRTGIVKKVFGEVLAKADESAEYKPLSERVESSYPRSKNGKAVIHGTDNEINLDKVEVTDFVRDKSGKVIDMTLNVDGKKVMASDIDFANDSQSYLFSAISDIENITPGDATVFIRDYDPSSGQTVGEYLNGIDEAYTYGYHNYSEADMGAGQFAKNLAKEKAKGAYVLGQNTRKNSDTSKSEAIKRMRTAAQAEAEKAAAKGKEAPKAKDMTITYNDGGKIVDFSKSGMKMSAKQKGGVEVAKVLHKMGLGTNFEFFSSKLSETLTDKDGNPARVFVDENGQEQAAYSGLYRKSDGTIRIDLNAYNGRELTLNAMAHELTHFIQQWSDEKYKVLTDFLMKAYEKTGMTMHQRVLREQARLKNIRGEDVSYNEAYDEVVANAMMKMFDDGKLVERLTELKAQDADLAHKLWEGFKKILSKFFNIYNKESALFWDTHDLTQMKETFEQLQDMFAEALVEASDNFQAAQTIGLEIDAHTESVSPAVMHSEHTWTESDYVQERDKAAVEIAKAIGVSKKKAKAYIDSINSIAKMIAEDRSRLDYFSSPGRSSFVDNAEYGGSFDFSTLCKKRRLLTGTFTAIQKALPNTALTADEILDIRNRMKKANIEVSCGLCYVEGSRANMGQFAKEFLRLYKQYYPDAWQPNMADVNTPDGIEWVRINHPECYEQYEYFWNHYGTLKDGDKNLFASQQKPKLYQLHTEYKGEILNKFKNDDKVEDKNLNGGIRLQSFSDFEIVHLIDTMQIIMDMSRVGLAGQAYTKVPDFAWALGDTGLKINLSLIAKGVDENGNLIFDDVEGMPIADAMKLRDRYSKNVGTILVAFNDEQLLAAMADDRVDFIIPFHRSQWKKSQYEAMGLPAKTKDYTFMQNEKFIKPQFHEYRGRMVQDKASNYMPNEYWDFSKSGKENAEAYLEMCARNNKRPKFYKLLQNNGDGSYSLKADGSTDGYWKLLIDFKMYDNDGKGSPQMAVKPEFNMEEANRMLNDYNGGHSSFPVAQGIVDGFVKDYKASHKGVQYSTQDTDLDTDGNKLSEDQQEFFEESKVRDEQGRLKVLYHGSRYEAFTEFDISQGVWLTPVQSYAEVYAEMWHSWRDDMDGTKRDDINGLEPSVYADPDYRLYKMYANIKNPADIGELNQELTNAVVRNLAKAIGVEYSRVKTMAADYEGQFVYEMTRSEEFIELAHQQGFDGFKASENGKETWCAFSAPNQVKLTTNEVPSAFYDIRYSSQETDLDKNKNRATSDSPLTRRSVKQRSVGSTHVNMSSTAAAGILGIENIANYSESVKEAISVLGEFYVSVDTKKPVLGFKRTISASNLEGSLVSLGVLKREGASGSAYRYDDGHALRISNHSANANNFIGDGEHLSIALFERGKMNDFVDGERNVIEAVFRKRYLDNNPEALKQVIHDIAHFIAEGEYHDTAGAMRYNFSGTEAFKEQAKQRMAVDGIAREQRTEQFSTQQTDLDTEGKRLTKEQIAFFKDSKLRDESGRLIIMYHGTNNPNFTVFDPQYSDDKTSLFFTSDPDVANTYTNAQDYGRDVDPYNLITKDSSADQFNAAQEKLGGGLRVVKITPEWISEMKRTATDKCSKLIIEAETYAYLLEKIGNQKLQNHVDRIRRATSKGAENLTASDISSIRSALFDASQAMSIYNKDASVGKKAREQYKVVYDLLNVEHYVRAARTPESAIGKYTYTETNSMLPFAVATTDRGFTGNTFAGSESEAVAQAIDRSKWVKEHSLGNRYKVYLNLTNPYIIDAGTDLSGRMDHVSLTRNMGDSWKVELESKDNDFTEYMTTTDFMAFVESAFDAKTTAKIKAQIEANNEAYQKEWGDLDTDFVEHDIKLKNVDVKYVQPGNWNALEFNGVENARTRDVTAWAKDNGYDGVIFKNMKDTGGYAFMKGRNASTVAVAFKPDQVKSVDNKKPTSDQDMRYSTHETDNVSNRDLLANAFESITNGSEEYKLIQRYKSYIAELNSLENKLSEFNRQIRKIRFTEGEYDAEKLRKLESEAKKIADAINKYDQYLLSLEASGPLRKVIERERKKEAQKTKDHVKEIQENKKLRAEQTELRHKIRKAVRDLDKILKRGDKKRNVKEDMKGFVSKALELADYLFTDHISNDELIRRGITVPMRGNEAQLVKETEDILTQLYDNAGSLTAEEYARLDAKRKKNMDKLRDLLTEQRNERLNTPVYNLFNDLITEYASLKNSNQDAVKAAYDPKTEEFLRFYIGEVNGQTDSDRKSLLQNMRVADMTTKELEHLLYAYEMVLHSVKTANEFFVKGMTESIEQKVEKIVTDFSSRKTPDGKVKTVIRNLSNKLGWDYEKLYYALERIGSDSFTELIMNVANSEDIVMQDIIEAAEFRDEIVKKYGFNDWDVNKKIDKEFLDNNGKKFTLTLGELMSLYAYSRREGAWDHIEYGGFVFGEKALTDPKPADSYKLSKAQCEAITNTLTEEQKNYVKDMQKFLSETMGGKGNEVSMRLYGVRMFGEKNYFPIHIAGQYKAQAQESQAKQAAGFGSMSNAGFTHAQNPNAKAPFVLEGFNEVWSDHVNEMSRYHGAVPALEDLRRVMNRSSYSDAYMDSMSVKAVMENSFGKDAVDYFDNLYREANSGAITDKLQNKSKKLLSLFRKNSVAYSLSVLVQQPASLVRAYALIDRKYFGFKGVGTIAAGVGKAVTSKWNPAYANAYNEMLKYAPGVTMAKEIGGFDTATGGSIRSYLLDTNKSFAQKWKTDSKGKAILDKVDNNAFANLPNVADKIAWIEIWNACKRETVAKHKDLATSSEEFMKIVGERFTEVIRATQVYDSIFAKSPMLKSKNLAVQYLVSFMNEPNTVANMAENAVREAARGNLKQGARTAQVVVSSIIFTNVLKSIIYALRDDDEDETYIEKYIEAISGNLVNDFIPFNYIPIARDVWSLAQGYDVERADMAIVSDAISAAQRVAKNATTDTDDMTEEQLIEFEKKATEANWKLVDSLAAFFGIPVKNVRREIDAVRDHARIASENAGMTTSTSFWDKVSDAINDTIPFMSKETKTDKLYDAIISGDSTYVDRMKSTYKTDDSYHNAVRKTLRENDPRIREAAIAWNANDLAKYMRIAKEIIAEKHFTQDDVVMAIRAEANSLVEDEGTTGTSKAKGLFTAEKFASAIASGDYSTADSAMEDIIQTAVANGKTDEEAVKSFISSAKSELRDMFVVGEINEDRVVEAFETYFQNEEDPMDDDDFYWMFREWNYEKETGSADGYGKYNDFYNAVQTGKSLRTVIKEYTDHGIEKKTLASQITSYFKPLYKKLTVAKRASLKNYLLNAYVALGYNRYDKSKDIDAWLKD